MLYGVSLRGCGDPVLRGTVLCRVQQSCTVMLRGWLVEERREAVGRETGYGVRGTGYGVQGDGLGESGTEGVYVCTCVQYCMYLFI